MDNNSKPKLPSNKTYRDPATGRFLKREEGETRVRTGGSVQVGTGGAVSNDDVVKFIQSLAQQKFNEGMASSYNQPVPESDMKREEFAKLFDTITNKVISKLGAVNSSLLELKKSNNEQGNRLINLSTSIYSSISAQKDTIDELYKIIDSRLTELVNKEFKSNDNGKDSGPDKQSFRTAGLIRGIGGLNKQLVELNKSVTSKVVPLLSSISDKISNINAQNIVAAATPPPSAATPTQETEKIPAASTKNTRKQDEKSSYTMSKLEMLGDGLTKLIGGGALVGLGASLNDLSKNISNLPQTIGNIIKEKSKETTKNVAKSGMEIGLSPLTGDDFFKENPEWFDKYTSFLRKTGTDIGSIASTASDAIFKSDISPFSTQGYEKDLKELDAVFGQVSSTFKLFVDDISHVKKFAEESGLFNSLKEMLGISSDSTVQPNNIKPKNEKPGFLTKQPAKSESTNSQKKPKEVIERAKPKLRNQPIGQFSIVNSVSSIDNNILRNPISPINRSIQESTMELEESKNITKNSSNNQNSSPVIVNNSTSNNQNMGLLNNPSPRNTESTKQTLDRLMLYGNYTGTGFLVN
jgi:hypothetical protein